MGAVHGAREQPPPRRTRPLSPPHIHLLAPPQVHLKYVAASALCSVCAYHAGPDGERIVPLRSLLVYSAATHGLFAGLFVARVGMGILGKQRAAGVVPWWSYLVWAPFHSFTYLCSPNAPFHAPEPHLHRAPPALHAQVHVLPHPPLGGARHARGDRGCHAGGERRRLTPSRRSVSEPSCRWLQAGGSEGGTRTGGCRSGGGGGRSTSLRQQLHLCPSSAWSPYLQVGGYHRPDV